jgi:cytochrome c peroxidase
MLLFFKKNFKRQTSQTIFILFLLPLFATIFFMPSQDHAVQVDIYFSNALENVEQKLYVLKSLSLKKSSLNSLQQKFREARLAYKNLAILSEYFNQSESRYLNGPAVSWVQDDVPDIIIPPHGFQAIETILFGQWKNKNYKLIEAEVDFMQSIIQKMKNETDRMYKFKDDLVWEAIRSACLKIAVLDITGYESPAALYSFPEARAALQSIKKIISFYKEDITAKDQTLYSQFNTISGKADLYLSACKDFNSANRLTFITSYINPLYKSIIHLRRSLKVGIPGGRYPVNADAESFFAEDFMNIDFFSPAKEYLMNPVRIELGKKLFYDPILSGTKTRSCATCHKPELGFADSLKVPISLDEKTLLHRNTPTLWNSVFQTKQFFDSRATILENQLDEVVHNTDEMKGSLKKNSEELKKIPEYASLFNKAYPDEKDPFAPFNIGNAISSYVRSLVALNSRFDQYMRGNKTALNVSERNGFNLFAGKAKCATCHFIPLFNGLIPPAFTETESEVLGVPATNLKTSPVLDPDPGKFNFTRSEVHKHAFKIPTLRNIQLTAPYMHNGVYYTLEEVMEFYNNGGGAGLKIAVKNQTLPPDKLNLSKKEIADVIAFMKTLTDTVVRKAQHY